MNKINNKKGFTLIELLAVIVIMGILMMVAIPSISRVIENSRKDTFVDIAKSYVNAARNLWTTDNLICEGRISSAVDDGDYYILINTKDTAKDHLPVLLDQGGKSSWGNRDVNGYVRVNVKTTDGVDSNGDGIYEVEPKRTVKFYVALTDGTHGLVDNNTKVSDNLVRGDINMQLSSEELKKVQLTVDDGKLDCAKSASGVYSCTEVTPISNITGICVDDNTSAEVTGNGGTPAMPVVNGSATFSDGVTLSWAELQLVENATRYGYSLDAITNTTIGPNAFIGISTLISITIPNSITAIGNYAFRGTSTLENVSYYGTTEPSCSSNALAGVYISAVKVPVDYTGSSFCGQPVSKEL